MHLSYGNYFALIKYDSFIDKMMDDIVSKGNPRKLLR